MARDVGGVALGMALLEPGFVLDGVAATVIGRLRVPEVKVDPIIDAAVDMALRSAGMEVVEVTLADWCSAYSASAVILDREAALVNRFLTEDADLRIKLGQHVAERLAAGGRIFRSSGRRSPRVRRHVVRAPLGRVLAGPAARGANGSFLPPALEGAWAVRYSAFTKAVNLAGLPALSQPVPAKGALPAGLQLIGPERAEGLLLMTGLRIQEAAG